MDFPATGAWVGGPDQGIDSEEITDIDEANKIIKQKNRTIHSLRFEIKEQRSVSMHTWLAVYLCVMAFGGGYLLHVWMDQNCYGECTCNDYCIKSEDR
jgi:hypothetical protein